MVFDFSAVVAAVRARAAFSSALEQRLSSFYLLVSVLTLVRAKMMRVVILTV